MAEEKKEEKVLEISGGDLAKFLQTDYDPMDEEIAKQPEEDRNRFVFRPLNIAPSNLARKKGMGYEVVPGAKALGDRILGRCPKEVVRARKAIQAEHAVKNEQRVGAEFREKVQAEGSHTTGSVVFGQGGGPKSK